MASILSDELISQIKGIQIRAKHLVNDVLAGEYTSAFKGRGIEFEEVREYQPGDDVRTIDWNVTARSQKPFVKTYRDERELTVMFVVDVSASARFGTIKKFKNEIAAEITALLAYTALRSNDKVGLIIFSDHVEHYLPPKKGRGHIWQLIRDILQYESQAQNTDIRIPLEFLNRVIRRKAITFLISDFQDESFEQKLRTTARRHDLIAIAVRDPREMELPNIGYIELEDAETGEAILVDTGRRRLREEFRSEASKRAEERRKFFVSNSIDLIEVETNHPYIDPIAKFFRERDKQRK